jgi:hypothetical protein
MNSASRASIRKRTSGRRRSRCSKDEKGLADIGTYYLLNGDRATAESLYDRSFQTLEFWATVSAAGGYLGVPPQE